MNQTGIASWFQLSRDNFILDPISDYGFYAPRTGVDIPSIVESLQIDMVTGLPPKRMFWGLYGGGKTHTLFAVANEIDKLRDIHLVYVECPNLARRSKFLHLYHDGIMASMGQDFVINLLDELIETMGIVKRDPLLATLKKRVGSEEMARAIASLLGADSSKKLGLWRFLSGVDVPKQDMSNLEQTEDLTEAEPGKLADVIVMLGRIVKTVRNKTLVLILDELDRLEYVGEETGSTFQNAFRRLVDPNQKDVSILMASSANSLQALPEVFGGMYGPVLSRLGDAGLVPVPALDSSDVDGFIKAIIGKVRKENANVPKLIETAKSNGVTEILQEDFFPFSQECLDSLKGVLREIMTPREITQRMTQAMGKAYLMKRHAVTRDVVQ